MSLDKFGTQVSEKGKVPSLDKVAARMRESHGEQVHGDPVDDPDKRIKDKCTQYSIVEDRLFFFTGKTVERLPAGIYSAVQLEGRLGVSRVDMVTDHLIDFPGSMTSKVIEEINGFWDLGDQYKKLGFLHRRGYLFYGPQGTGKSSVAFQVVSNIVNQGDLAFYCDNAYLLISVLTMIRRVEPERPIIVIFEDIDTLLGKFEEEILQYLDGVNQINKVINLATTNYPEVLDPRIVARPRRFDQLIEIDDLPDEVRRAYIEEKLTSYYSPEPLNHKEVEELTVKSRGLPFAALGELILALKCHGTPLQEILDRLFEMDQARPRTKSHRSMGFDGYKRSAKQISGGEEKEF